MSSDRGHPMKTHANLQRQMIRLFIITLLVTGCGMPGPLVTKDRMIELKNHFVGREFVFRTDWTNQLLVYKGEPTHLCLTTPHAKADCLSKSERTKKLLAAAGTLAKITDVTQHSTWRIYLAYETDQNKTGKIIIETEHLDNWAMHGPMAHAKWTNDNATPSNLEAMVSRSTIRFLAEDDIESQVVETEKVAPPKQLSLTPAVTPKPQAEKVVRPQLRALQAVAEPARIIPGKTLRLNLDYRLETGGRESIEVTETRHLIFNGKTLPGYPKQRRELKSAGQHTSTFRQQIPSRAKPGVYTYKGEVCIDSACSSQLMRFSVESR
ncbi:MAG: hypothetical protein JAZ19_19670 [Candidatus Thiodiazotropha taylori]|nr:hypothetical protein [Candidatus Thiodiazotropha taylori]